MTLASFALRRATGELVLRADDTKEHRIAFMGGVVVAASSPLAIDSIARIALTSHMVTSSQIQLIQKRLAAQSARDEIDVVAEIAKLPVEHAVRLRRRVITQRAARTFSVDSGLYRFDARITLPVVDGVDVDIRPAVFLGVHMNLSEVRLADDCKKLGSRFTLDPQADITRFGFSDAELAVVESLRTAGGRTLPELDAQHRNIAARTQQAIVYALVACGACTVVEVAAAGNDTIELESRTRTNTWRPPAAAAAPPRTTTQPGAGSTNPRPPQIVEITRQRTQPDLRAATQSAPPTSYPVDIARARTQSAPTTGRVGTADPYDEDREFPRSRTVSGTPLIPRTTTPARNVFAVRETISAGLALLAVGADHYTLLGVDRDARLDTIRSAYVAIASQLHRDKLPPLDPDTTRDAHRVFAAVNVAFGVLCDPVRRSEYTAELGKSPVAAEKVDHAMLADVAFRHGLLALKREDLPEAILQLTRATEHAPNDVDYQAMLAWARFCASSDKQAIAPEVRKVLQNAIYRSPKPMTARFYLGRVERMLGRVKEALHHFREVLELEPGHVDAAAEVRLLEPRTARR